MISKSSIRHLYIIAMTVNDNYNFIIFWLPVTKFIYAHLRYKNYLAAKVLVSETLPSLTEISHNFRNRLFGLML